MSPCRFLGVSLGPYYSIRLPYLCQTLSPVSQRRKCTYLIKLIGVGACLQEFLDLRQVPLHAGLMEDLSLSSIIKE